MKTLSSIYVKFEEYLRELIKIQLIKKNVSLLEFIESFSKVFFIFIPLIIGIIIVLFYLSINLQFNSFKNSMLNIIEIGLAENLKSAMISNDFMRVRNSLEKIRELDAIENVILVNKNRKVIISDELNNEGIILDYPELNEAFENSFKKNTIKSNDRIVLTFENENSCQRCHFEDDKILGGLVISFTSLSGVNNTIIYLVLLLLMGLVANLFAKNFFKSFSDSYLSTPINALVKISKDISKGEVISNEKFNSPNEFKYIFNVLAKMAGDIDDYIEEIKRKNSEKEKIKILAGIGEMAAKVAHEVRNPLNTIDGAIHYLKKTSKDDIILKEYLDLIEENIKRINNVASELLNATKPVKPVLEKVNVVNLIRERIQEFSDKLHLAHVVVSIEAKKEIPIIFIDKNQFTQVIDNLVENSINAFSELPMGQIKINVKKINTSPMQNFLLIRIFDNGCGIKQEDLQMIFTPFFTTRQSGTGLGLSIVEKIISNHRGEIKILSKQNRGTFVNIKLPLRT
ncbi:MAG: GHKL domain-containing protein [Bacteroidetes bacterium]|nr:GHKL domain-containing protein [Bacteroidota bacterium]